MKRLNLLYLKEYVVFEKDELYDLLDDIRRKAIGIDVYADGMGKYAKNPEQLAIIEKNILENDEVIRSTISNYIRELL